ncbi:MAG: helix-turn-helix transcriptional regulator [Muribaculaceae bacterium]|nr:helix-turn-helix transcriptional regulator [Muribaculaceae bacterium]
MNALPLQENLKKFTCTDSCPVRNVISRFSGKWTLLVLCVLSENEATRFNSIAKAIPDISPKVLTDTLKNLEADGYVLRKMYSEIPPKVEYSLSELGKSLMPLINNLVEWSMLHYEEIESKRKGNRNRR